MLIVLHIYYIKILKILYLKASFLHASAGFEVGANAFTSSLLELWELAAAGLDDGLDLLFWLLGDGHHPVQIFIYKQPYKHLGAREEMVVNLSD